MKSLGLFLTTISLCVLCGIIYEYIHGWSNFVGWIFLLPTAGYFFLTGANYYNMGLYSSGIWMTVTFITIPIMLFFDGQLIENIDWYNSKSCFAYYLLYVVGYLLVKLKVWSPPRVV